MSQRVFKNQITAIVVFRFLVSIVVQAALLYYIYTKSAEFFYAFMAFIVMTDLLQEVDILRNSYTIEGGFLHIVEYTFLFHKMDIRLPLSYIDKVEEVSDWSSILNRRRLHIYVGEEQYQLRAITCRNALMDVLINKE